MAPFSVRVRLFVLTLILCLALIPARTAAALPSQDQDLIKEHVIKFYLDPALVPDMHYAQAALTKYVEDMNFILQKNTDRQLVFDPQSGILLVSGPPHSDSARPPLPVDGFEIWAHAVHTSYSLSYGGYGGIDETGAGVLAGLKWTQIYDPDQLEPSQVKDYWTQIHNMLHELAHVFGAGYGEYYGLLTIQDTTATAPLLNINAYDQNDPFWSDKPDSKTDPLLWNPVQVGLLGTLPSRQALLDFVQYSRLTAAIVNGDYRNAAPTVDLSQISIRVVDENGTPLDSANLKVWSVAGGYPYSSKLLAGGYTDVAGEFTFAWGGPKNDEVFFTHDADVT